MVTPAIFPPLQDECNGLCWFVPDPVLEPEVEVEVELEVDVGEDGLVVVAIVTASPNVEPAAI
jgi:hypothetical protein